MLPGPGSIPGRPIDCKTDLQGLLRSPIDWKIALQGMFEKKVLAKKALAPLAAAYVGYIVLNNLNLQINTVGFYQISKIAVAPAGREGACHCRKLLCSGPGVAPKRRCIFQKSTVS